MLLKAGRALSCRSCILQADSEKLRQAWIQAVQTSIASAYREKGEEAEVGAPSAFSSLSPTPVWRPRGREERP